MNKIYKVIWNQAKHCNVVTSEFAKGHTKSSHIGGKATVAAVVMATLFACGVGPVQANVGSAHLGRYGVLTTNNAKSDVNALNQLIANKDNYLTKNALNGYVTQTDLKNYVTFPDLNTAMTTEQTARDAADGVLDGKIKDEETARTAADGNLQTNINSEASTRASADSALQANINSEASTRESKDTALDTAIKAEATTRENADTKLQSNINKEKNARVAADKKLQSNIDTETAARKAADKKLDTRLTTVETNTGGITRDTATDTTYIEKNVSVDNLGNVNAKGTVTAKNVTATGTLQGKNLDVTKNANVGGNLKVAGDTTLHDTTIKGTLDTKGDAVFEQDVTVKGQLQTDNLLIKKDENNYTKIDGGNVTSKNQKVLNDGTTVSSSSTFNAKKDQVGLSDNQGHSSNHVQTATKTTDKISADNGKITNTTTNTADTSKQVLKDGKNKNKTVNTAESSDQTLTDGANTNVKHEDSTTSTQTMTSGDNVITSSKDAANANTVDSVTNGTNTVSETKDAAAGTDVTKVTDGVNSNTLTQSLDGTRNVVTDGVNKTITNQTATDINSTAKNGAIRNTAQKIVNTATDSITDTVGNTKRQSTTDRITDTVGKTTIETTTDGTTFTNTDANTPIDQGTITETTIKGNTITTGKVTMDYAEVMKDLGVHGIAVIDGDTTMKSNATVGKNLSVAGTSTLTGDVTMGSNASVAKDLTVGGNASVAKDLSVAGNTSVAKDLSVAGASTLTGDVTMGSNASVAKDLTVGGNTTVAGDVTASSYKVGSTTYIDSNGINANSQKITNVAAGEVSSTSTDAVNGAQLYSTNMRMTNFDSRLNKVGAGAAALANLHPLDFDPGQKFNVAAAVGNYRNETAAALGMFYRPNSDIMFNVSGTMGTGENMIGGGVSIKFGQSRASQQESATNEKMKEMQDRIGKLETQLDAFMSVVNPNLSKDFPDVPANHWAYEAVSKLAGNGIVEGYEDGLYHGERTMTRYEMAQIIYKALSKGAKAEQKLVEEFKPELKAMAAKNQA